MCIYEKRAQGAQREQKKGDSFQDLTFAISNYKHTYIYIHICTYMYIYIHICTYMNIMLNIRCYHLFYKKMEMYPNASPSL